MCSPVLLSGSSAVAGDELIDSSGKYVYMPDLRKLKSFQPPIPAAIPDTLCQINTPLNIRAWEAELHAHPDREYVQFHLEGIQQDFHIGFDYAHHSCSSVSSNMKSASIHPEPIDKYIREEVEAGRIIGPLPDEFKHQVQISRFGVIPKPHQTGKWRLITDLSSPQGSSVNDGVDSQLCSLTYASVDEAVSRIKFFGRGTMLAKFDIASAYRIVPVHPVDRLLLGMVWRDKLYVDGALPFGLRSAPKLFTALADGLLWIMGRHGIAESLHYLDDFLVLGAGGSQQCGDALQISLRLCRILGVPIANRKVEGPGTVLPFLGIQIDTVQCLLKLPPDKLLRLKQTIQRWQGRKSCKKRDLLSLIGQLSHACCVIRAGRTFLRRMIDLSSIPKELNHWVRLSNGFQSDLHWWAVFLQDWNGVSLFDSAVLSPPSATVTSDASGNWGCGAFSSAGAWFQFQWPLAWDHIHIMVKELLPVVVACAIWGRLWKGRTVRCLCDNAAVVSIIRSGSSKDAVAMHLMRCSFFLTAFHQLVLVPQHLPGRENRAADCLSRDALHSFQRLVLNAHPQPTMLPIPLMHALIRRHPDWTSQEWRAAFHSTLHMASQAHHRRPTSLPKSDT